MLIIRADVIGYHLSKGPRAVLDLYRKTMEETNLSKSFKRLAWGAVGYQRFLIGDLEFVWYGKFSQANFRQITNKSFREISRVCS